MRKITQIAVSSILAFATVPARSAFFSAKDFEVAAGLQSDSLLYKRGIITYQGYQVLPIYSIRLFNPNLLLAGSAIYYKFQILKNSLAVRTRLNFDSTGDTPLYFTSEKETDRVRREKTNEWDVFFEYTFSDESSLNLMISQDLLAHKGLYSEVRGRLVLADFFEGANGKALVQPGLFVALGGGDAKHNIYLYGFGATESGLNNLEYGLLISSPKVIDPFWPTLKITKFQILGDKNKSASYVKETDGLNAELLFAFKVW